MKVIPLSNSKKTKFKVALLMKESTLNESDVERYYVPHLKKYVKKKDVVCLGLKFESNGKIAAKNARDYLINNVLPMLKLYDVKALLVADSYYFKLMTGKTSKEVSGSYAKYHIPSDQKYHHQFNVMSTVSYNAFFYNPDLEKTLGIYMQPLSNALTSMPMDNRFHGIKNFKYPTTPKQFEKELNKLLEEKKLALDIEAFSLEHYSAGIATISFSKSDEDAVAAFIDYMPKKVYKKHFKHLKIIESYPETKAVKVNNKPMKKVLFKFICRFKNTWIYHNAMYDAKVLTFELFMNRNHDYKKGLLFGFQQLLNKFEDTQNLAYLANNSCSTYFVDLKSNSIEHMGNYSQGVDVTDITKEDPYVLIEYNGSDTCATYWLENTKYKGLIKRQKQKYLYEVVIKQATITFMQCELEGMGIDMDEVDRFYTSLSTRDADLAKEIDGMPLVASYSNFNATKKWLAKIGVLKCKIPKHESFYEKFNYKSAQLVDILHNFLKLPVLVTTDKGNPATDKKAIKDLEAYLSINETPKNLDAALLLKCIKEQGTMSTLLNTFIPAFKKYSLKKNKKDDIYYLFGHFKVPSTISGRPSSSKPNILNLPSTGSVLAKPTKKCFKAKKGRLLVGADYASMEYKANALLTSDPNMLAEMSPIYGYSYEFKYQGKVILVNEFTEVSIDGKITTLKEYHDKIKK